MDESFSCRSGNYGKQIEMTLKKLSELERGCEMYQHSIVGGLRRIFYIRVCFYILVVCKFETGKARCVKCLDVLVPGEFSGGAGVGGICPFKVIKLCLSLNCSGLLPHYFLVSVFLPWLPPPPNVILPPPPPPPPVLKIPVPPLDVSYNDEIVWIIWPISPLCHYKFTCKSAKCASCITDDMAY